MSQNLRPLRFDLGSTLFTGGHGKSHSLKLHMDGLKRSWPQCPDEAGFPLLDRLRESLDTEMILSIPRLPRHDEENGHKDEKP